MPYYQILQQRRVALGLSIQDISSQTRLAPEYIQAVEVNNLAVFSGDMVFARQFVQAYCEVIGVNFEAIRPEVDANINAFSARMAAAPQPTAQPTEETKKTSSNRRLHRRRKKSSKDKGENIFVRLKKRIDASEHAMVYRVGIIALVGVVVLSLVNLGVSYSANRQAAQEEEARQAELQEKEDETKRLAEQKKNSAAGSSDIEITTEDKENNVFEITNVIEGDQSLEFNISMPEDSTIVIYKDNDVVSGDDTDKIYTSTFNQKISVDSECTIQLEIGTYADNKIKINGKTVTFDETNWSEDSTAVLYFDIKASEDDDDDEDTDSDSSSSTTESTDDTSTEETTTEDTSEYYYEDTSDVYSTDYYTDESTYYYDESGNLVSY